MSYRNQNNIALCIPRIEEGITAEFVREIFKSLDIGDIKSIDLRKTNKSNGRKAFINMYKWNTTATAEKIKYRLNNDLSVNIMYKIPWYWKLKLAYNN
tara:strand:+ start:1340 stop:1633 length:294 start_codon:yes stop_codon:yes gene_type:complete